MVGQPTSIPVTLEPLRSPPALQNASGNSSSTGQAQGPAQSTAGQAVIGNNGGLGQAGGQVSGPLGNVGGLGQASGPPGADGGLGQTAAGASHGVIGNMAPIVRTGDSFLVPLITGIGATAGASGLHAAATSSRPSSSRPSTGSSYQALGPLVTPAKFQGGYHLPTRSWSTDHGFDEQAHAGPSTTPPNNNGAASKVSISSLASTSSAYSHASWNSNSSTNNDNSGSVPPILPSMEDSSSHQQQYQQHLRRTSSGRGASRQVTNNADYEYQPYTDVGSSSMGGVDSSQEAPLYDERGRPLDMPPEKAPLVHLDGALYQEPPGDDQRSGYEPPAYIQ